MNYILDDVQCKGDETSLFDCKHNGINKHNCGKRERAGVKCIGKKNSSICCTVLLCVIWFLR